MPISQCIAAMIVPLFLAAVIALFSKEGGRIGLLLAAFVLGALAVLPISRLGGVIEPLLAGVASHFYGDELLRQLFSTALPEEWGKGLAALLIWRLAGRPSAGSAAITFAAAAHCGFAAAEGLLGALGNEGWIKVVFGRSLGSSLHCSWGVFAAWMLWLGWRHPRLRALKWTVALWVPGVLHAIGNAAQMEIPGVPAPDGDEISLKELAVVLPGLAATLMTWALAVVALVGARRSEPRVDC